MEHASHYVMVEQNLWEWSSVIFTTAGVERRVRAPRTITKTRPNPDGPPQVMSVTVGYVEGLGTLTVREFEVFLILCKFWQDNEGRFLPHPTTLHTLTGAVASEWRNAEGWSPPLPQIEHSLIKLASIPIRWENAWYDAESGQWLTREFTILERGAL